jgi:hypothetical protein
MNILYYIDMVFIGKNNFSMTDKTKYACLTRYSLIEYMHRLI